MISDRDTVVIGVSGGADSVCLFHIMLGYLEELKKYGKTMELKVVHVNHMIRDTALRDEEFVKELCEKFKTQVEPAVNHALSTAWRVCFMLVLCSSERTVTSPIRTNA